MLSVVADFEKEYGTISLEDFLERISLVGDTDDLDEEGGYVSLMTLHNAKGLEFPVVFMTGMEEEVFPHIRSIKEPADLAEERRLCYVGMTRAERFLYLTDANTRSLWGGVSSNPISRFLLEIPGDYVEEVSAESPEIRGEPLLVPELGEEVVHAKWGSGIVKEVRELEDDCEVKVDFDSVGSKRLLLKYAPLARPQE
jgi:DNA helicase-2/ATP-dependent DNA helicase PcrA